VEEGVRRVNGLLVGLLLAAVSALFTYLIGPAHGKQQTVFQEQAKILAEVRK
jgi:hypothetical protein